MKKFLLSERYRLELHWTKIEKPEDGVLFLKGAYFSGPVLKQALRLNDNDNIKLDFCNQYSILVNNFYVATLSWGKVDYVNDIIKLNNAVIKYRLSLDKAAMLKDKDYLVIDTANHELAIHQYNMLYTTYIINNDDELIDYRNK